MRLELSRLPRGLPRCAPFSTSSRSGCGVLSVPRASAGAGELSERRSDALLAVRARHVVEALSEAHKRSALGTLVSGRPVVLEV